MVYFLKGNSHWREIRKNRDHSTDPEYILMKKVAEGTVTDAELNLIERQGGKAYALAEAKRRELTEEMQQVERVHGKGVFDGIDNDGNLFKDTRTNLMEDGAAYNPETNKLLKDQKLI